MRSSVGEMGSLRESKQGKMRLPTAEPKWFSDHKAFLGNSTSYSQLAQSDTLE